MPKNKPLIRPPSPDAKRADSKDIVEAIITAGHELASSGLHKVSVSAVAARAGVGNASVYRYFPDKGALFAEIFRRQHQTVLERLTTTLAESTSLREATWRAIEGFAGFDEDEAKLRRALNFDVPLGWSMAELVPVLDASMGLIATHLTRFLPELSEEELRRRVFYAVAFVRGAVMMRLLRPERAPAREEMLKTLSDAACRILEGTFDSREGANSISSLALP